MNEAGLSKLEELRADYEHVVGRRFENFYCPILFRDENVELCRAHVINKAFQGSDRGWTIQRSDVDSFYGSIFEADFLSLQDRRRHDPAELLIDPRLSPSLRSSITMDSDEVEHYRPVGPVPDQHSRIAVETSQGEVEFALKIRPTELLDRVSSKWEIQISKDLRLPALASALKAAHLTLFNLLGYRYALSAGGHFLGRSILGEFFDSHNQSPRQEVLTAGNDHFREFVNMVRPMLSGAEFLTGTASDGRMYLLGAGSPWGILVIIRTGADRQAVLVPVLEKPNAAAHFMEFLKSQTSELAARLAVWEGDHFQVSTRIDKFEWPAADFPSTGPLN